MRLLSVCSARPNFVKLAAIHHALKDRKDIEHVIVHTGQHYDPLLSDVFFSQLEIPQPDENLGIHGGTREEMIQRTTEALVPVLQKHKPDWVLVYGDVNGALAAARAAQELGISIAHVEAGLRSGDLAMPEEHNRIGVDAIADALFCTEQAGMEHLKKEQCPGKAHLVGNTMIDTLMRMMPIIENIPLPFRHIGGRFAIATLHRPSNVDDFSHLQSVFDLLNYVGQAIPVVLPMHPRTQKMLEESGKVLPGGNVSVIGPMAYLEFIRQMKDAAFILTDSGGIQEEAVLLQKRCFTLRRNTERPITLDVGSNILIDPSDMDDQKKVLDFATKLPPLNIAVPSLWDGHAGTRIVDLLAA